MTRCTCGPSHQCEPINCSIGTRQRPTQQTCRQTPTWTQRPTSTASTSTLADPLPNVSTNCLPLSSFYSYIFTHICVSCTRLQSVNWILMHLLIYWLIDGVISRVSISFVAYMIIMNIWYRVINTLLSVDFHGFTLTSQANQSCLSCLNKLETITNKLLELNILQRLFTDLLTKASTSK